MATVSSMAPAGGWHLGVRVGFCPLSAPTPIGLLLPLRWPAAAGAATLVVGAGTPPVHRRQVGPLTASSRIWAEPPAPRLNSSVLRRGQ